MTCRKSSTISASVPTRPHFTGRRWVWIAVVTALLGAAALPCAAGAGDDRDAGAAGQPLRFGRSLPVPQIDEPAPVAGEQVTLHWRSLAGVAEEFELIISLDDGRQYDVRVSPELVSGVCRFVWTVPNLPVRKARLRLRARVGGHEVCGPEGTPFSIIENPVRPYERWTFRHGEWWEDQRGKPLAVPGLGSHDHGATFRALGACPPVDEPVRGSLEVCPQSSRMPVAARATSVATTLAPHAVLIPRSLPRRE